MQFPLVELHTEAELVRKTAWEMDRVDHLEISDQVSMCNYRANRLVCDAADRAIQVHGGIGYTRHAPFEHIYRHHRRYRITEGSEEIQMRKVAAYLFGYLGPRRKEMQNLTWADVDYRQSDRPTEHERAITARADQQHASLEDEYIQPTPARP